MNTGLEITHAPVDVCKNKQTKCLQFSYPGNLALGMQLEEKEADIVYSAITLNTNTKSQTFKSLTHTHTLQKRSIQ